MTAQPTTAPGTLVPAQGGPPRERTPAPRRRARRTVGDWATLGLAVAVGALIAVLLPEWLRFSEGWYLILYSAFVLVLLAITPTGLLGILDGYLAGRRTRAASDARAAAAPTLGEAAP